MKFKSIKDIKIGDYVKSYNLKDDKIISAKVTDIFKHKNTKGKKIIINDNLIATPNHPIYINGKYRSAMHAKTGDYLIDLDGNDIKVNKIETKSMTIDVYNIEVEGEHNYFAGNMLNHNKCGKYEGNDQVVQGLLDDYKESAQEYAENVQSEIEGFLEGKADTIGIPTGTETNLLTQGGESVFTYTDETGTSKNIAISGGWQQEFQGQKTDWGVAVDDFYTASADYSNALTAAADAALAAEESRTLATEDVADTLEEAGKGIVKDTESSRMEIETASAKMGFAATGVEQEMKESVRSGQASQWNTAETNAQNALNKALDEYKNVVGDDMTVGDIGPTAGTDFAAPPDLAEGEVAAEADDPTRIGTLQQNLNTSYNAFQKSITNLSNEQKAIQDSIDDAHTLMQQRISGYRTDFKTQYTTISGALAGEDASHYLPDFSTVADDLETAFGSMLGVTEGDFNYDAIKDMNLSMDETAGTPSDLGDVDTSGAKKTGVGDKGGGGWFEFSAESGGNFLDIFGTGKCLEGNVKIAMGDKDGE
jgi:hypothetical protein